MHRLNISYMDLLNNAASPLVKQKMLSAISHPLDQPGFTPNDYLRYMNEGTSTRCHILRLWM